MIERLDEIRRKIIFGDEDPSDLLDEVIDVLREEIRHRLEFEAAVLEYLNNAPGAPFAAADALKRFILEDTGSEAR